MFRWSLFVCALLLFSGSLSVAEESFEIIPATPSFDLALLAPPGELKPSVLPSHFVPPRYADMVHERGNKIRGQLAACSVFDETRIKFQIEGYVQQRCSRTDAAHTANRFTV